MTSNPLLAVKELGQSIWLDFITRRFMDDGKLQQLIQNDGLKGVTSNPTIVQKAIGGGIWAVPRALPGSATGTF